jgi:hypothetical protein
MSDLYALHEKWYEILDGHLHQLLAVRELPSPGGVDAVSMEKVMAAIDNLAAEVAENRSVTDSAVALLGNIKAKLDEAIASGDMGQVQALSDELDANNKRLADAVAANTPAANAPAPTPTPVEGGGTTEEQPTT